MSVSAEQLQQAIYTALSGNAGLTLILGASKVYDWVPETVSYPYVAIGDETLVPFDTQTEDGLEATITIHSWSQGAGRKEVKQIMDQIYSILNKAQLSMDSQRMIDMRFEFSNGGELDPDGFTYHGVQRFRALIEET